MNDAESIALLACTLIAGIATGVAAILLRNVALKGRPGR